MFKLIHRDKRGKIWIAEFMGKEYLLLETKAGFYRGGDYHQTRQTDIVLRGSILWVMKKNGYSTTRYMRERDINVNPPLLPHMMISITDSLVLEWLEEPQPNKTYYKSYRDIINEANRANAKKK